MEKTTKKVKQNIYKWHRAFALVTFLPVLFWTLSGMMHPFMAHLFKPEIAHDKLNVSYLDPAKLNKTLHEILAVNKLSQFKNFRIVKIDSIAYYQIKTIFNDYKYFNASNAQELKNGDVVYAQYLSRYFLDDQKSKINSIEIIDEFSSQYKYINRYLPVYKINFDRPDKMDVYVETSSGKLATFNPVSRKIFLEIFDFMHTWSFIEAITNNSLRIVIMIILLAVISFSAMSGLVIYGFFYKQFKKTGAAKKTNGLRKNHRKIGIFISLFTLLFAFSGGYHAIQKWNPNPIEQMVYSPIISASEIKTPSTQLKIDWKTVTNLSLIKQKDSIFYQCQFISQENEDGKRTETTQFIDDQTNTISPEKQTDYAEFLARKFAVMLASPSANCCEIDESSVSELSGVKLVKSSVLNDFDKREYGFVNKRLPVVKLEFDTPTKTNFYIDTNASCLATRVSNSERYEGLSFAVLHKFLYMDWAGKTVRDIFSLLIAFTIALVSILGMKLFWKKSK
jgi:PepSY-associated TM region